FAGQLVGVELVVVWLDVLDSEAKPTSDWRMGRGAVAVAIRVIAITLLEVVEVSWREGSALLRDLLDIGSSIVDPGSLGGAALRQEDDIRLCPLRIRAEGPTRTTEK